jgi:hypothetical protein
MLKSWTLNWRSNNMAEAQLINIIADGGAFALCAFLVTYVMQQNAKREERFATLQEKYAERFEEIVARMGEMAQTLELIERRIPTSHTYHGLEK